MLSPAVGEATDSLTDQGNVGLSTQGAGYVFAPSSPRTFIRRHGKDGEPWPLTHLRAVKPPLLSRGGQPSAFILSSGT